MAQIKLPAGLTPDVLIMYLIDLGITLSAKDQDAIRADIQANQAEVDRVTGEAEQRDEDARQRLGRQ